MQLRLTIPAETPASRLPAMLSQITEMARFAASGKLNTQGDTIKEGVTQAIACMKGEAAWAPKQEAELDSEGIAW